MPLQKTFKRDEVKLDSVLSLVLIAQENQRNCLDYFYAKYNALFNGHLNRIEAKLYEDGLIEYSVGERGIEIQLTPEGRAFSFTGGYAGNPNLFKTAARPIIRRKVAYWNYIAVAGFFIALIFCIVLNHKKG